MLFDVADHLFDGFADIKRCRYLNFVEAVIANGITGAFTVERNECRQNHKACAREKGSGFTNGAVVLGLVLG